MTAAEPPAAAGTTARPRACAIVVAGGSGKRFGNPGGKQLVPVAGRPLLSWSLLAHDAARLVGHIVVVCPRERRAEMVRAAIEPLGLSTPVTFADAGAERQDSTRAGLAAVPEGFDLVSIHDGARPLIAPATIDAAVERLAGDPGIAGVVCGQPAIDTLKLVEGERFAGTPERARFWTVQTPQVFRVSTLARAYASAAAEGFLGTDDASLVERLGAPVVGLVSPRDNIKVTVPEDLPLVEALLRQRA